MLIVISGHGAITSNPIVTFNFQCALQQVINFYTFQLVPIGDHPAHAIEVGALDNGTTGVVARYVSSRIGGTSTTDFILYSPQPPHQYRLNIYEPDTFATGTIAVNTTDGNAVDAIVYYDGATISASQRCLVFLPDNVNYGVYLSQIVLHPMFQGTKNTFLWCACSSAGE